MKSIIVSSRFEAEIYAPTRAKDPLHTTREECFMASPQKPFVPSTEQYAVIVLARESEHGELSTTHLLPFFLTPIHFGSFLFFGHANEAGLRRVCSYLL